MHAEPWGSAAWHGHAHGCGLMDTSRGDDHGRTGDGDGLRYCDWQCGARHLHPLLHPLLHPYGRAMLWMGLRRGSTSAAVVAASALAAAVDADNDADDDQEPDDSKDDPEPMADIVATDLWARGSAIQSLAQRGIGGGGGRQGFDRRPVLASPLPPWSQHVYW